MRWLIFGTGIMVFVAVMTAVGLQFTTHGTPESEVPVGPRLQLESRTFDLGDVPATEIVERTVPFRNTGVGPLEVSIVKVRPAPDGDCGCGVEGFEVRPRAVPPGERGELVFLLKVPEGMPAMEDKMIAEISTNDPARPSLKISLVFRMDT